MAVGSTPGDPTGSRSSALGTYHEGLDGIRAVGMAAVLLYHGGVGAKGSFLALSQFFTLSGFLITGMLVRAHDRGGVELGAFWSRRMRRLVPASLLALGLVVVFGATVATKAQVEVLPGQVTAAALWVFNWHVLATGESYADMFAAPSPVDHFWSLSLEEQFYVGVSFGFVLLVRLSGRSRVLLGAFGALAVASTVWTVWLSTEGASLDRLYLGTDTRLAEIVVGSLLAVVVVRHLGDLSRRTRLLLGAAGAAAYVVSLVAWFVVPFDAGPMWNGGMTAYAVLTAVVILGILSGRGPLAPVLSFGPLPAIGRLVYGLYLFHWPVFLWLDEDRTGLSPWPLLILRVAVSASLAVLSKRFVEQPILERRWSGMPRWLRLGWAPVAVVGLVVTSVAVSNRDAPDPAATFRVDEASLAMPVLPDDGVMDVLAIVDDPGEAVVARMSELGAAGVDGLEAEVTTVPFACTSVVQHDDVELCREWADSWPDLITELDPDVVLVHVRNWAGSEISAASGRPPEEAAAAARALLGAGFDVLSSGGAPVVFSAALRFEETLVMFGEPFHQAIAALERERDDVRVLFELREIDPTLSDDDRLDLEAVALLGDLALYQRAQHDLPRIMVVGDSMARSLGFGLERWAVHEDRALVWNVASPGCGLARTADGSTECDEAIERLAARVEDFDPDIVLALSSAWDLVEREVPGGVGSVGIDDDAFAAFLRASYLDVVDVLGRQGATVVWLTAPCSSDADVAVSGVHPVTLAEFNERVVEPVVAGAPNVALFDLAEVLCPGGEPLLAVDGVGELRIDGIHFSVEGSMWFAETYGPELLALGGL